MHEHTAVCMYSDAENNKKMIIHGLPGTEFLRSELYVNRKKKYYVVQDGTQSVFKIKGAPYVHILAAGCMISKAVHPAGAPFFQMFSIDSC